MAQQSVTAVLKARLNLVWTEIKTVQPYHLFWGMADNRPMTRVADVGQMTFALDNSGGLYSPNGPSALAGWKTGIPFFMLVTFEGVTWCRFYGIISEIKIGQINKDPLVYVTVLDWMDYAIRHKIINPGIMDLSGPWGADGLFADDVLNNILPDLSVQPQITDFDANDSLGQGLVPFATALDTTTSHTTAYDEFIKIAMTEIGYIYLKKDRTYGETLVFESFQRRHGWVDVADIALANEDSGFLLNEDGTYLLNEDGGKIILNEVGTNITFDSSVIEGYEAVYGQHIINRMTVYDYPRYLDASPVVLFRLSSTIPIASGETISVKGTYADPSGGLPINAQDMIAPVATTDYLANTLADGSGTNITADIVIVTGYGTEGFTHSVTNNNASSGFITLFNCRGTGIYLKNPISHAATNAASITEFETQADSFNQVYTNQLERAALFVDSVVDEFNQPKTVLNWISFHANKSGARMMNFLYGDVGDMKYIDLPEIGVTGNYYIQGVEAIMNGGLIECKWYVKQALSLISGLAAMSVEFRGGTEVDAVNFGFIPYLDAVPDASNGYPVMISLWVYIDASSLTTQYLVASVDDTKGFRLAIDYKTGANQTAVSFFRWTQSGYGSWYTTTSVPTGQWAHILIHEQDDGTNPAIWINGSATTVTVLHAPVGDIWPNPGLDLILGNGFSYSSQYQNSLNGKLFDVRMYGGYIVALGQSFSSTLATTLYNGGVPDPTIQLDNTVYKLLFQAFAVKSEDYADYLDTTLTSIMLLRDNVFGVVGTPNGSPIGRAAAS